MFRIRILVGVLVFALSILTIGLLYVERRLDKVTKALEGAIKAPHMCPTVYYYRVTSYYPDNPHPEVTYTPDRFYRDECRQDSLDVLENLAHRNQFMLYEPDSIAFQFKVTSTCQ